MKFLYTTVFIDDGNKMLTKVYFKHTDIGPSRRAKSRTVFIDLSLLSCRRADYMEVCKTLIHSLTLSLANYIGIRYHDNQPRVDMENSGERIFLSLNYNVTNQSLAKASRTVMSTKLTHKLV